MSDNELLEMARCRMRGIDSELKAIPRNYKTMKRRFALYKQWRELKNTEDRLASEE